MPVVYETGGVNLRALIVGTGSIGQRHMRNLRSAMPQLEFILLRRNKVELDGWPEERVVTDLAEALQLAPDLAVVASPSALHIDVLPALIAAGIPSYVEKPIVTSADDAFTIRRALERAPGAKHYAGFNLRYLPSLRTARAVADDRLGRIVRASFTAGQWLPDWRKGLDHRQSYSADSSAGGGVLFDLSHEFDAARFFLGDLELLAAETSVVEALEIDSEGVALAIARAASGALASVAIDYVARKPIRRYELVGTLGTLVWDLGAKSLTIADGAGVEDVPLPADAFDVAGTYTRSMQDFLNAITSGLPGDLQNLEDGLSSTDLPICAHSLNRR